MILMMAPGPNMAFRNAPSGTVYVSDARSVIAVANNSVADQAFFLANGCYLLTAFGGWGNFGFTTLANLYAADTGSLIPGITGYPQFTIATVFNDSGNSGFWYKTGTGNGSGSWTQVPANALKVGGSTLATGTAAPASGSWARGDRVFNSAPSVGNPKSWVCTVAGTPGTWVSEGNL